MKQLEMDQQVIGILPEQNVQSEQRPWGMWQVLAEAPGYKVKLLEVAPRQRLSLQYHLHRSEHWFVASGIAMVTLGDENRYMERGDSASVPAKMLHRIENPFDVPVIIVEVQQGVTLEETDIVRVEDDYERVEINWRKQQ